MKKNIALMTGGDSSEWQISLKSASTVERNLDPAKYNVYQIILRDKRWYYTDAEGKVWDVDRNDFSITVAGNKIRLDYALILIHGTPGEDGRLQGYLDMMGIPYSSSGFFASVLTFDKSACKRALAGDGIPMAREILLARHSVVDPAMIVAELGLPLFVKPNASGSSFGVTKVKEASNLIPAIEAAFGESDLVLIEEFMAGREVSCGIMIANGQEYIFPVTELVFEREFFDYQAKYEGCCREITPAPLDPKILEQLNRMTLTAYRILNCRGVARIDFIIREGIPHLIEVNTVPGMTDRSIIPQQAQAMGMSLGELLDIVIEDTSATK